MILGMLGLLTFILYSNLKYTRSRWEKNPVEINLLAHKFKDQRK